MCHTSEPKHYTFFVCPDGNKFSIRILFAYLIYVTYCLARKNALRVTYF